MAETATQRSDETAVSEAGSFVLPFREAPHNIEAEQALLGALLTNNDAADRVSAFLDADHFFEPVHGRIFEAATKLIRAGKLASPVTLKTYFEADEALQEIGGTTYLARLAGAATTIINAEEYGRVIYDLAIRRNLIAVGTDMVNQAYDAKVDAPPQRQIEEAEQQLYGLAERGRFGGDFMNFSSALTEAVDMAANAYHRDGHTSGLATGFRDIDEVMGGLQPSDLLIVAGRPSMGKTAFGTNIAYHVARNYRGEIKEDGTINVMDGAVVGFFSLEMSSAQLATRVISEQTAIPSEKIRRGTINREEFGRLVEVARDLQDMPLFIDETGGINLAQLTARARRLKRQHGLGLLIVDYLQLLTSSSRRSSENRVQEVTEITQGLKALAKELNIPIVALSQLSRQVESRDDKRPQLADLRESGSIEQDADIVMFVFREEYYLQRREPREGTDEHLTWQEEMARVHQQAEIIIGKNRHGPTSSIALHFEGEFTRFSDLARSDHLPERFD
ncbi:MAG: replicative DNA helicase [Rhizobiales bacterium]|nr:replicative DNA helicase [Hyphomicrobiales bacterium]